MAVKKDSNTIYQMLKGIENLGNLVSEELRVRNLRESTGHHMITAKGNTEKNPIPAIVSMNAHTPPLEIKKEEEVGREEEIAEKG